MNSKNLLYITGNCIEYLTVIYNGKVYRYESLCHMPENNTTVLEFKKKRKEVLHFWGTHPIVCHTLNINRVWFECWVESELPKRSLPTKSNFPSLSAILIHFWTSSPESECQNPAKGKEGRQSTSAEVRLPCVWSDSAINLPY